MKKMTAKSAMKKWESSGADKKMDKKYGESSAKDKAMDAKMVKKITSKPKGK